MAKAIKAAVTIFAVTFLVVYGISALGVAFGVTATVGTLFGVTAVEMAVLSAVGTLVSGLMSKGINATAENFGSKIASRTTTAPRQIIYGKARVGGAITHIETSGTDNYKLSMIVVLAGHEVESLEEVMLNDTVLTTTSSGGFQNATNSKFINTDNGNNFGSGRLLRYVFVDGSQTAANSTITNATSLTSTDKFIGMSYMLVQMVFDSEAFGGGIPPMSFVVKGKKVYDPRTTATAWSDNPALCVRDFITNTTYGLKATSSEVLDTTALGGFSTAANTCDTSSSVTTATVNGAVSGSATVTVSGSNNTLIDIGHIVTGTGISGTVTVIRRVGNVLTLSSNVSVSSGVTLTFGEKAYTANGLTNMSADGGGVIEGLLSACAGKLSYIDGKFVMFAGANVTPEMIIKDDNLLAPISIQTKKASGETYNTVKAIYVDGNNNYVATDTPVYTDSTLLSNDTPTGESSANYRKTLEIQLPFTDTTSMAQRLQRTALLHTRKEVSLGVLCNIAFMQLQPFDWVYVTNERLGYTNKTFEVLSTNLEVLDTDGVPVLATRLTLKEIDSSVYAFASSTYTNPIDEGSSVGTGSFSVTAPTNFAVQNPVVVVEQATTNISINTTWTNNPDDLIQGTEIKYGTSSGTYTESQIVGKGVTSLKITNLLQSQTYFFVARHFSVNNVFSGLTSQVSKATGASTTVPNAPTNLDASSGSPLSVKVSWINPNNSDLSSVKIYATTSNSAPSNETTLKATVTGEPNAISTISFGEQNGLTAGTTFYFWAKAVNKTGLTSAFTSSNSGNFTKVNSGDIDLPDFSGYFHKEGNTTNALSSSQFNTEYGRTPLNDDILIMVNTSATPKVSKAYKWNGSAFAEISNFTTGDLIVDGTIAGSKVIARTITAGNIATGTLTANEIEAGTITATQIAADAITAVKIDVNNLQAISADLGSISAGNLNIGSGTFVVLSNGALTATSATITGAVTSNSGTIGGFTLGATSLIAGTGTSRISLSKATGIHLGNNTFGSAPFRVTLAGALTATSGTVGGFTLGTTSLIAGSGTTRVSLSTADGIHLGNNTFSSAPFQVTRAGALTATGATITGEINATSGTFNGSIAIGSGNNIFKADSNGIYLGNSSYGSATFKVSPSGIVQSNKRITSGAGVTQATLSGDDDTYRFWSGGTTGSTADFSVSKTGELVAKKISIYNDDGGLIFSSQSGFTDLALTEISATTGTPVATVSSTFSANGDSSASWQSITLVTATSLSISVKLNTSFGGSSSSNNNIGEATSAATAKIPVNFTLQMQYSANGGSSWNNIAITAGGSGASQQFTRTTSSPSAQQYKVNLVTESEPGFFVAFADVVKGTGSTNSGSVDSAGFTTITGTITNLAGASAGTTYKFRTLVTTSATGYDTNNKVTATAPRTLTITDSSGSGFYVDNGDGSQTVPSGDITSVSAGTNLNGGGTSGAVTLNLDSTISGNHTFSNNMVIGGNLTVQGTTTTIDTANLDVKDKNITLNYGTGDTSGNANDAGITIQDAVNSSTNATILWDKPNSRFKTSHGLNVAGALTATTLTGTLSTAAQTNITSLGTLTALTITGNPVISNLSPQLFLQTGNGNTNFQIAAQESVNNAFEISSGGTGTNAPSDTYKKRLVVQNIGDISFFEDTGSTAKLFWDASDERLNLTGSDYQFSIKQGSNQPWFNRAVSDGSYRLHLNGTGDIITATSSGANVIGNLDVGGAIEFNSLSGTGSVSITDILDQDNMSSNSATALATQQSIKAYVLANASSGSFLPLSGGTLTGTLSSNSNIETTLDMKARILYSKSTNNSFLNLNETNSVALNASSAVNLSVGGATKFQARSTGALVFAGSLMMGSSATVVIDASRNLTNIGTISSGAITSTGDVEVRSGNKLILQRPNNAIASIISTDSTGAMILDSLNSEGFFFNNAGTNAFKLDHVNATFAGTISANATASNSAPKYTFTGDTDTGLGYIGANAVGLIAGGSRKFYVNATGAFFQNLTSGVDVPSLKISGTTVIDGSRNLINMGNVNGAAGAFGSLTVDNFTLNGTTLALSSGDMTLDVAGDIILDADGGDVQLRDGGTPMARLGLENGDLNIANIRQDYDILFKGMDGNTTPFTALKLDMSEAGLATFNSTVTSKGLTANVPTGSGLLINSADVATIKMKSTGGGVKNWGFATTNLAASDFGIYESNANGGDPITAGSAKLYFNAAGAATFSVSITAPKHLLSNAAYGMGVAQGNSARFDTVDSGVDSDPLELAYYSGSGVRIGQGGGTKYLAAGSYQIGSTVIIDGSRNLTNIGTISSGKITAIGTGTAGAPTLDIINNTSITFNHTIEAMTPNLTAGESNILVFGRASSTKNAGYIGYRYSSSGSNDNVITLGHWASDHLVTINGVGNTTFAGTIGSGAITSTSSINSAGGYYVSGTEVISASRNLTNIGTATFAGRTIMGGDGARVQIANAVAADTSNLYTLSVGSQSGNKSILAARDINTTAGGYQINATTVIDSSRNLTNIGTISASGSITTSGAKLILGAFSGSQEGGGVFFRPGFSSSNKYNLSITARSRSNDGSSDGLSIAGYEGVFFSTGSNSYQERFGIDISGNVSIGGTNIADQSRNLFNLQMITTNGALNFGANTTNGRFDISVGGQTTSRGMVFIPYTTFGTRYSSWDTWIGQNARTSVGLTDSNIKLATGFTGAGASALNVGFFGLNYYTWSTSQLSGLSAGSNLTLGTAKFAITGGGDLQIGGTTVISASRNISGGTITTTGNLVGASNNTTEIGTYSTGAIKRIRMAQGGELHFGDTTTGSFLGMTEGAMNNFGDQDRIGLYYRNELKLYAGSNLLRHTFDISGNYTAVGAISTPKINIGANFGSAHPLSVSTSQRYVIGFRNTGATQGSSKYPWLVHDSDKFIVHWNAIGDKFSIDHSGNVIASGNVTAFSDERLKTNIQTLDSKKTLQMRGVSFTKDGEEGSGVIAQEIEKIAPELVHTNDDEMKTKSVAYGNLVGYLIETVKDQQKQIDELKEMIKAK